jgi:hypothetical protein
MLRAALYGMTLYRREELMGTAVCSAPTALAKNFAVTVSTDTPAKDEVVFTTFDFDLDAPILSGTAYYDVTLNGFPYSANAPLCQETAKSGDVCPLAVGHHHEVSNSTNTVTGKLVTKITWKDDAGSEILCAQITTKTV